MSRDGRVALPRGAMGLSAVCDCSVPDHTHLLFSKTDYCLMQVKSIAEFCILSTSIKLQFVI